MPAAADHKLLTGAVREAGALALDFFRKGAKSWNKKHDDPVSEADIAVDRLLRDRLIGARPDYGWLSEEAAAGENVVDRDAVWVIDPIDGTRAFLKGEAEFSVSVALVRNGVVVSGVVFNPATDEFFEARLDHGALLNGRKISASGHSDLREARLLASKRTFERHGWIKATQDAEFTHRNSIAYRLALVAAGRFETAISMTEKNDWDVAAGAVIVTEAGGNISTAKGAPLDFFRLGEKHQTVVASGAYIHDAVLTLINSA